MWAPEMTEETALEMEQRWEDAHWFEAQFQAEYEAWLEERLREFLTEEELAAELDETGDWDPRE